MSVTSKTEVDEILKDLIEMKAEIFDKETKLLKSANNTFWNDIIKQCNFNISSQYLYLNVLENRLDILTKLQPTRDLYIQENNNDIGDSGRSKETFRHIDNKKTTLNFKMELSIEQWYSICDSVNSENGDHHTLKPHEWSLIVQNYFYTLTKRPCCLSCNNVEVYPNAMICLKINGKCTVCLSDFQAVVVNKMPLSDIVTIDFIFHGDYKNCKGTTNKKKIIENKREESETKLINKDQSAVNIFENVKIEVVNYDDGHHDNTRFNLIIVQKLIDSCKSMLWYIVPIFVHGDITKTRPAALCLFSDLKIIISNPINLPCHIDKFLKIILVPFAGSMNTDEFSLVALKYKIYHYDYLVYQKELEITKELNSINKCNIMLSTIDKSENETENKNKIYYLENDPNDRSITDSMVIGILKNGNFFSEPMIIEGCKYSLSHTCAFDSLAQVMCSSYVNSIEYSAFVDQEIIHAFFELVSNASRNGINDQIYQKRAIILVKVMRDLQNCTECPNGNMKLNCSCTLDFMIGKIFANYPSLLTTEKCTNCAHTNLIKTAKISVRTENLNLLNDNLLSTPLEKPKMCKKCENGHIELTYTYGKQIFIEPYDFPEQGFCNYLDFPVVLHEIPKTITVQQQIYNLRGIISFIPPLLHDDSLAVGHYVAFCWRNATGKWEEYDDLSISPKTVRPDSIAPSCQAILYTI